MKTVFSISIRYVALFLILHLPTVLYAKQPEKMANATFAGGCFWCTQADFDKVSGVIKTIAGYTGGTIKHPTYQEVSNGHTGHYESVRVNYNPDKVTYQQLLNYFWYHIDPTDDGGQFCDRGSEYRAVIFYHDNEQKRLAQESKQQLIKSGRVKQVVIEILPAKEFYAAELYHQKYYQKNPVRYKFYRFNCGRDQRLKAIWDE